MIFTVAMPKWSAEAHASVQRIRRAYDPQFGLIDPHFTLIFGAPMEEAVCVAHVRAVAQAAKPLAFSLRHAMLYYTGEGLAYVYLVAAEGAAGLNRLYRQLHGGPMAPWLRLDKPFVPHITIAAVDEPATALRIADEWNSQDIILSGEVDALTAGRIVDGRFLTLAEASLETSP